MKIKSMKKLGRGFFSRPAIELAPALIGKVMVHRVGGRELRCRIVETEAYVGEHDLACHAAKGRTRRTEVMFGRGGHAYVYFIYGMHEMFNVVASRAGDAQAVLVRAAEPLDGWEVNLSGPGRFARGMGIRREDNGVDLTGEKMFFLGDAKDRPRVVMARRVGVDYSGEWREAMLRFLDTDSGTVSKPRPVVGSPEALAADDKPPEKPAARRPAAQELPKIGPATHPAKVTVPLEPTGMVRIFNGTDLFNWDAGGPMIVDMKDLRMKRE